MRGILSNQESRERTDFALLNAGAGFYVAEKTSSIADGVRFAREVLDSGAAIRKLEHLRTVSNRLGEGAN